MKKPEMTRETSIVCALPEDHSVRIKSTPDSIVELAEFGYIGYRDDNDEHWLQIDPRYDFWEVVCFIADRYRQPYSGVRVWFPSANRGFGMTLTLDIFRHLPQEAEL